MTPTRLFSAVLVTLLVLGASAIALHAQRATARQTPAAATIPPLSMTCPMHPDVVEAKPGSCPICKMSLVPVRLDTAWICPVHSAVIKERRQGVPGDAGDKAGTCPICGRPLVQARVALTWTCSAQPGIERLEPGNCPDGSPMIAKRTLRPHGNHNPQHGGVFFMAPDNWHHLEGTHPQARVFRLYLYDDYARPLAAADLTRVTARVVTNETFDAATRTTKEITAFPLKPAASGAYLEARIERLATPAVMSAKVKIKPDAPEYRFDFTFPALTKEPTSAKASVGKPASAKAAVITPAARPTLGPTPATLPDIVAQIKARNTEIADLIRQGNFPAVWVPAFQAKDLAVALEARMSELPPSAREAAMPALEQVVRFAWLLDSFGDLGNRQQVEAAYAAFASAVTVVANAFGGIR